jgi:general secretion pathway protein D
MKSKYGIALLCLLLLGCATGKSTAPSDSASTAGKTPAEIALEKNPNDRQAKIRVFYERYRRINGQFEAAEAALAAGNRDLARQHYNEVLRIDPGNPRARNSLQKIEDAVEHDAQVARAQALLGQSKPDEARSLLRQVIIEDPDHERARALFDGIEAREAKMLVAPRKLKPTGSGTVTLEFRDASLRNIFEVISRTSGINIILDPSVRPDLRASIFVKDASVVEVIDFLLLMHQLDKKVLTDNSVLIYPISKALQYDDLILRTFYLNHADAKQTASLIKAMLPIKDVFVDEKLNMLSLKATYEHLEAVEKLIADEDLPDPEVLLDVEILEIRRTELTDIGIAFPDTLTLLSERSINGTDNNGGNDVDGDGIADSALTLEDFSGINRARIGVSPGLAIRLLRQDGESNLLANPRIRVKNREKAKIHIGDKIPIPVTTIGAGNNSFIGQSANYLDVGLKLDVEPRVMLNNEVSIRISLEVSNATFTAGSLFPTIGTRNTSTVLMSGDGETQVLAGLISDEDRNTIQKVPGLSSLPIIGRLFTKPREEEAKTEIVLLITPHVVRNLQPPSANTTEFYSGTAVRNTPINMRPSAVIRQLPGGSQNGAPAVPAEPGQPAPVTPVPGTPAPVIQTPAEPQSDDSSVPSPGEYNTGPNVAFPPGTVNPLGEPVGGQ